MILFFFRILCAFVFVFEAVHGMGDDTEQRAIMLWRMNNIRAVERPLSQFPPSLPENCLVVLEKKSGVHHYSCYCPVAHTFRIKRCCSLTCINGQGCEYSGGHEQEGFDCYSIATTEVILEQVPLVKAFLEHYSQGTHDNKDYKTNFLQDVGLEEVKTFIQQRYACSFKEIIMSNDFLHVACIEFGDKEDRIVVFSPHVVYSLGGCIAYLSDCRMNFK